MIVPYEMFLFFFAPNYSTHCFHYIHATREVVGALCLFSGGIARAFLNRNKCIASINILSCLFVDTVLSTVAIKSQ